MLAEAFALHKAGRLADAEGIYKKILSAEPDHFDCLHLLGVIFNQRGNHAAALRQIESALKRNPASAPALSNRGIALSGLKRFEEAIASYDRALTLSSGFAQAHFCRGNALYELRRFSEALVSYDGALALQPNYSEAHCGRGNALHALGEFEEALPSYDRALGTRANYAEAHSNRGLTLHELQRFEEALASYDRALALRPDYAEALTNRGVTLQELKRFDAALASYNSALKVRPDYAKAHYDEAICRLLIGDLARGFEKYEWRWETEQLAEGKRKFSQPLWLGSDEITGKTILLHAEQGLGDTLQFCRYVPLLTSRGVRVILEVQKPLSTLMGTLAERAQIVSQGDKLPDFDFHCPLLSLPLALGTQIETIPSAIPYLSASESKTRLWRDRLGCRQGPRIGIVWAGNSRKELSHGHRLLDSRRSLAFDRLEPVLQVANCDFYSLQKGDDAVLQLRASPMCHRVTDWTDDLHDFSDTAALVENLDLIISVDTSVAHLAGALGKPVWLLNRYDTCWRWLLNREDSPWYPTVRLFRQDQTRDWDSVVTRVGAALQDYVRELQIA
jgi:tetratricopeptide (TPR) repeat protein